MEQEENKFTENISSYLFENNFAMYKSKIVVEKTATDFDLLNNKRKNTFSDEIYQEREMISRKFIKDDYHDYNFPINLGPKDVLVSNVLQDEFKKIKSSGNIVGIKVYLLNDTGFNNIYSNIVIK